MSSKCVRLNKALASAGVASRRACDELVFSGQVTINGKRADSPGIQIDWEKDIICIKGKQIKKPDVKQYFALHKPVGYTCTNDSRIKKRACDLIPSELRLFTVGRLDRDTTGLILVTNDGDFAHHVMHPSFGIDKEYVVKVDQEVLHEHLVAINQGAIIENSFVKPKSIKKMRRGTIKIIVQDGKKHEVRLLVEKAGLQIRELKRVRIGSLPLGTLEIGSYRELNEKEIDTLLEQSTQNQLRNSSNEEKKNKRRS